MIPYAEDWYHETKEDRTHNQRLFWTRYRDYYTDVRDGLADWFSQLGGQV